MKTRPYILIGLRPGIERAFRLTGLTTGALHNVVTSNIVEDCPVVWSLGYEREERNKIEQALAKQKYCREDEVRYMYKEKGRKSGRLDG